MTLRCDEPGWVDIGKNDGRRSLWVRFDPEASSLAFEVCAGREGDDDYVRIDASNPQFFELRALFGSAMYAAELASPDGSAER